MKFLFKKGNVNEITITEDDDHNVLFMITLTSEQIENLRNDKTIGVKVPEIYMKGSK